MWELSKLSAQFSNKPKIYGRVWVWTKRKKKHPCVTGDKIYHKPVIFKYETLSELPRGHVG